MAATTPFKKSLSKSVLSSRKDMSSSTSSSSNLFSQGRMASMFAVTRCTQCISALPDSYPYKWCESCRAKDRERSKRKKERAKARLRELREQNEGHVSSRATGALGRAEGSSNSARAGSSSASAVPQKRKVGAVDIPTKAPPPARPRLIKSRKRFEYQTQDGLFDALAARVEIPQEKAKIAGPSSTSASNYLNFWGGYTIVLDPDIPLKERVESVASGLKERMLLPLGLVMKRVDGCAASGYTQRHWCTCMGVAPPLKAAPTPASSTLPASQSAAPLKRSGSMLMTWLAGGSKSRSGDGSSQQEDLSTKPGRGVCGGTISIRAVVDSSHPLAEEGMKGQRVSVQVEHPGCFL
ncbi:hypothetical protein GY45DRAFT_1370387 [Cubamyces sp. BRFM 1775]|nr:hypothetical protein GY45DRAFT_1370387 [Cubamyces sp. BRFM 1775]